MIDIEIEDDPFDPSYPTGKPFKYKQIEFERVRKKRYEDGADLIIRTLFNSAMFIGENAANIFLAGVHFIKNSLNKKNTSNSDGKPPKRKLGDIMNLKQIALGGIFTTVLALSFMMFGINDAGHRTVIQYPNGVMSVKFDAGIYPQFLGRVTTYNDVITFDYDKTENSESATIDQQGISVRYQDGGMGTIYGIARFKLPSDEKSMLDVQKEFRSNEGVAFKLIKAVTEETLNHTAGLMNSEESYAEKRGTYAQQARVQLEQGKFATRQKEITTTEVGFEFCLMPELTPEQKAECRNVKKTRKMVPEIALKDGMPIHLGSDLKHYGISITGFQMVDWSYEQKTLDQIAAKRAATMSIITAKANAEKAKQDAVTAEQQGLANVVTAKYEKEVEKQRAVVDAQREKEVAVIAAERKVEVASQAKLEAEQKKFAAVEYKEEQTLRGEGDAAYKQLVMEADGALQQKLDAYIAVNSRYATAIEKQKWVPEVQMGGSASQGGGDSAQSLLDLFMTKTARDLSLDMKIK